MRYGRYGSGLSMTEEYKELCDRFLNLSKDEEMKAKLHGILYDGGFDDFSVSSGETVPNNHDIEKSRRLSMAYLLLKNPETFEIIRKNNSILFHGTNSIALPSILKNGLHSHDSSNKHGIDVQTGEKWSRFGGEPRKFISITDSLRSSFRICLLWYL